jgi:hypothetical protein
VPHGWRLLQQWCARFRLEQVRQAPGARRLVGKYGRRAFALSRLITVVGKL